MPRTLLLTLILAATALGGCGEDRLEVYERDLVVEGPIALDGHAVLLNNATEELLIMPANGADVEFVHVPVGRDPVGLSVAPNRTRLAVLSRRDDTLTVVDLEAPGSPRDYPLPSPFDRLTFSPDSRYAIAFFSPGAQVTDVLVNLNQYAVIDLEASPEDGAAVATRTLRGFGSTPDRVYFVPEFELGNPEPERYAMFLLNNYITFVDLEDDTFEITAPLTLDPSDASVRPTQVLFSDTDRPELQDFFVYLLAEGSDDVYAINLLPGEVEEGRVRLEPNINQLPSGAGPSDIAPFIGPDGREKILSVNRRSADISLIDAATANVIRVPLGAPANRIHLYDAFNPRSGQVEPYALLYGEGMSAQSVSFVALMELEDRRGQAVEELVIGGRVGSLFPSPLEGQAVVLFQGGSGVALLDLEARFSDRLQSSVQLQNVVVDSRGARLFATLQGSPQLNTLELATSSPRSLELDNPITRLLWLPKAETLLAFHNADTGLMTALHLPIPADGGTAPLPPSRERAAIYAGFMLHGILDR